MVDYTTSKSGGGGGFLIFLGAAFVLSIVLYAIYAGGDVDTSGATVPLEQAPAATEGSTTVLD